MIPANVREVVDNLVLKDAASLRKEETRRKRRLTPSARRRERTARKADKCGQRRQRAVRVGRHEHGRVEQGGTVQLVDGIRSKNMCLGKLPVHLRLIALIVKRLAEGTGVSGLKTVVA